MFCSKCGSRLDDNAAICPECGKRFNEGVAQPQPETSKKSNTGMKIAFAVLAVVAVAAIVIAVLMGTGTISFEKKESEEASVSDESKNNQSYDEPEIGSVSSAPAVTADKSVKKVMLKMDFYKGDDGRKFKWVAADFSNPQRPATYLLAEYTDPSYGETVVCLMYEGDTCYMRMSVDSFLYSETYKQEYDEEEIANMPHTFGRNYNINPYGTVYTYLGKENLKNTGEAYIYEAYNEENGYKKFWVDTDTGYTVKSETDNITDWIVAEIIEGDAVELPEFDKENAIEME